MARPWKEVGRYGSVGLEFVLTILISGAFGGWLDKRFWGDHGYGLAGFFLLGVATAFLNLVRTANQMQSDIEKAEARDPEAGHWKVDEGWLHPPPPVDHGSGDGDSQVERDDGDAKDATKKGRSGDDPRR